MMQRMDAVLAAEPQLTFALAFDLNAYAPAHNSVFTKDITGDRSATLRATAPSASSSTPARSRAPRGWSSASRSRARCCTRAAVQARRCAVDRAAAADARPFLLQSYARDTGAVLTTLSMPLYVKGQRFGCVCLGWDPDRLRG